MVCVYVFSTCKQVFAVEFMQSTPYDVLLSDENLVSPAEKTVTLPVATEQLWMKII